MLDLELAEWQDDDIVAGDGDMDFLQLVSSFLFIQRVNLGWVPLKMEDKTLPLTEEYCHLNRIHLEFEIWHLQLFDCCRRTAMVCNSRLLAYEARSRSEDAV